MQNLVRLVLLFLVACVCWWAVNAIMAAFGIGDPIATVVRVVLVLVAVVGIVQQAGGGSFWPFRKD